MHVATRVCLACLGVCLAISSNCSHGLGHHARGKEGGGHITTLSPLLGLSIGLVTVYSDQSSNNMFIQFLFKRITQFCLHRFIVTLVNRLPRKGTPVYCPTHQKETQLGGGVVAGGGPNCVDDKVRFCQ